MIEPHAAALAYLRFVLDALEMSATALAKSVGVSATTLTRPLNDPDHKFAISTTTIGKIAKYSGINPGPFFEEEDISSRHFEVLKDYGNHTRLREEDAPHIVKHMLAYLPIVGEIANANSWQLNEVINPLSYGAIAITATDHKSSEVFGIAVVGNGASLIAKPGEMLLCVKCSNVSHWADNSDFYIVQEFDDKNHRMFLSVYVLNLSDDGTEFLLKLASHERNDRETIKVEDLELGNDPAKVIGKVKYVFRAPAAMKKVQ